MNKRRSIGLRFPRPPPIVTLSPRYSRFVGLMKLVLPVSAVVLVAMVVAWPYLSGRDDNMPLSFTSLETTGDDTVYMTNARYLGTDENDQPYSLTADMVSQATDDPNIVHLSNPKADITLDDGVWLALSADNGTFRRADESLSLDGAVNLFSDHGYEFHTESVVIDLKASRAYGNAPISGQGPIGLFNADSFSIESYGRSMMFEGRVRLVVYPKTGA